MAAAASARADEPVSPDALRIERVEVFPVRYPTVMRFKFFEGPVSGGGRPAVIIKITASDGTVGWGESVPIPRWSYETLEGAVAALENYLVPTILGMDALDIEAIHAAMAREIANGFSTGAPITKAGIDIALHDLLGKHRQCNVAACWGRESTQAVTLSWTLNPKSLDEVDGLIDAGLERGYRHFNVKVAPDLDADVALCKAVKARVPDGFLWADANGGYDVDTAKRAVRALADEGVPVLEQPIPIREFSAYQELRAIGALPILIDEGVVSPIEFREFIRLGMCDGVAMKPARCGGLVSARAQIELAQERNLMVLGSGLTDPDISLAASLHLYSAYGISHPCALNGPQFLGESVLAAPLAETDGTMEAPQGMGLGIDVDEEKVRALVDAARA